MADIDAVSLVALVVSVVALIGAILQLLQQYASSAEGYSNCGEAVMGEWALARQRKFRYSELRFEVQFEAPVIFMCPPTNNRGPLGKKDEPYPLWHVRGTPESEQDSRTPSAETEERSQGSANPSKRMNRSVRTADNERANWFILLQALHAMERDGLSWQQHKLLEEKASLGPKRGSDLPVEVAGWEKHTVVAALQPKRKSWDTMPSEVRKPYATSTISHVVEMAAVLGLRWRELDRSYHRYHAEGNGFLLTGGVVDDLGIMFHFQTYGEHKFEKQRVIPNDLIKFLAFGIVPTIHRPTGPNGKKVAYDDEDPKNTGVLQLGSTAELVESLTYYGCNSKTANYFRDDKKKQAHLFPVVFEILGMVAESAYIPDTYYRFLPNPTTYSWNRKNFSLRKLLREYTKAIQPGSEYFTPTGDHLIELQAWSEELDQHLKNWADEDTFSLALLQSLHESIKKCDAYLNPPETILMEKRTQMTKLVVREHTQEVMRLLNEVAEDDAGDDSTLASKDQRHGHGGVGGAHARKTTDITFEDLNSAAPEVRQQGLMEIYFKQVRAAVARNVPLTLEKHATFPYVPSVSSRSNLLLDEAPLESPPPPGAGAGGRETPKLFVSGEDAAERAPPHLDAEARRAEEIWCTLVYRMLCWLLLHDFHKKDVQISKSELYGSRLPVYIA